LRLRLSLLGALYPLGIASLIYFRRPQYILPAVLWLLVLFPGVFLYVLLQQFRNLLHGRREEIQSIMSRGTTFTKYLKAFESTRGAQTGALKKTLDRLFYRKYGRSRYYFPLAMNAYLGGLFIDVALTWSRLPLGLPDGFTTIVLKIPGPAICGLAGAFIWGLFDVLRRFEAVDLSPASLHSIWMRMLVASILAPMISGAFTPSLKPLIAFAVGLFPTKEIFDFVRGQARKDLNLTTSAQPAEQPNLHKLQGVSETMVSRLIDEGIESAEQLASYDPFKLLLRTNLQWKTILDIIDQAILFDYFGEKSERLREFGIRGSIELASIQEDFTDDDAAIRAQCEQLVASIACRLEVEEIAVRNAIRNAYEDVQVELLWDLWGDTDPEDDDDVARASEPEEDDGEKTSPIDDDESY
jgi:hypothetical protein